MARRTQSKKESLAPTLPPQRGIEILTGLINQAESLKGEPWSSPKRSEWTDTARGALERAFGTNHSMLQSLEGARAFGFSSDDSDAEMAQTVNSILSSMVAVLRSAVEQLKWEIDSQELTNATSQASDELDEPAAVQLVKMICRRFHIVARQLTRRRDNRETLEIRDEYDLQDLLHALLRLHFDDVRPEEWTPSYAGGASRMDFLLKNEQLVVEAKMSRASLGEKQISDQLTIDAVRYRAHPDCKVLVCFVYDPVAHIKNPRGIEADLARLSASDLQVTAVVTP